MTYISGNEFQIEPGFGVATETTAAFENDGLIGVTGQPPAGAWNDIYLWPISRNDYAMLPDKMSPGPPTQYWLHRQITPVLRVWPVPPEGIDEAFVCYRMVQIDDANPTSGQALDAPNRFLPLFIADLTAALAETWKPAVWQDKLARAELLW